MTLISKAHELMRNVKDHQGLTEFIFLDVG